MKRILLCAAFAISTIGIAHAADKPIITPVLSTAQTMTGQAIEVPANPQVIVTTVEIPPGAKLPVHKHPFARYGYVMEGTLTGTQTDTGKTFTYTPGTFIVEMRGQWHSAVNDGAVPVKLLVIDQVPIGTKSNTIVK
ncbi:MAG TPA: cupin domain-containing protein [Rhizomicrobium sp.]|nr:cupin domain-containing protein [Rhizomicrobium sp.]